MSSSYRTKRRFLEHPKVRILGCSAGWCPVLQLLFIASRIDLRRKPAAALLESRELLQAILQTGQRDAMPAKYLAGDNLSSADTPLAWNILKEHVLRPQKPFKKTINGKGPFVIPKQKPSSATHSPPTRPLACPTSHEDQWSLRPQCLAKALNTWQRLGSRVSPCAQSLVSSLFSLVYGWFVYLRKFYVWFIFVRLWMIYEFSNVFFIFEKKKNLRFLHFGRTVCYELNSRAHQRRSSNPIAAANF